MGELNSNIQEKTLEDLPLEVLSMIVCYLPSVDRDYRSIEQCFHLETALNRPKGNVYYTLCFTRLFHYGIIAKGTFLGELLRRFSFLKLLYEKATSLEQWRSFTKALDFLAPGPSFSYLVAGGFVAYQLGRTNSYGYVDVFVFHPNYTSANIRNHSIQNWEMTDSNYGILAAQFYRVYNLKRCEIQIILVDSDVFDFNDAATSLLYHFDLQICQCALLPNGKSLVVNSCMQPLRRTRRCTSRQRKYEERLGCPPGTLCEFKCKHWKTLY